MMPGNDINVYFIRFPFSIYISICAPPPNRMTTPRPLLVATATDILAREGGSVLIRVWTMMSAHHTCTVELPPRDGQERARADVEAYLSKCPELMPIHIRVRDDGIDVRCAEAGSYHTPYVPAQVFTDTDPSHAWWKAMYEIANDASIDVAHHEGHFIKYVRTILVSKEK